VIEIARSLGSLRLGLHKGR